MIDNFNEDIFNEGYFEGGPDGMCPLKNVCIFCLLTFFLYDYFPIFKWFS